MTRLIIKNTVDMRLLTMQLKKLKELEKAVVGEGEGGSGEGGGVGTIGGKKLGLRELANLFGFLKCGKRGEVVGVEADYVDEEGSGGEGVGAGQRTMGGNGEGSSHGFSQSTRNAPGGSDTQASGVFGEGWYEGLEGGYGDVLPMSSMDT